MLDISELHQAGTAKDTEIAQFQAERDELRRQLEQSETSRQRLKAENVELYAYIEELEANVPAEAPPLPDLSQLRDQVLREGRVAKKGELRERIEMAINKFIEKLQAEQKLKQ